MSKEEIKEIDLGEYIVKITYSGDGKLDIDVFDELGEQIEGIYILRKKPILKAITT